MAGIFNNLTNVLQTGANNAININTMFFGVDVKIYYPKQINQYSGQFNDIDYDENPQFEGDVIIPEIYTIHQYINGNSFQFELQECTMYSTIKDFPMKSKVVAYTQLGMITFLISDREDYISLQDKIAVIYKLTPIIADKNLLDTNEDIQEDSIDLLEDLMEVNKDRNDDLFEEFGFIPDNEIENADILKEKEIDDYYLDFDDINSNENQDNSEENIEDNIKEIILDDKDMLIESKKVIKDVDIKKIKKSNFNIIE